jgi:uncharacterized membrane protein
MDLLFSGAAAEFWMRWFHYFFGVLWIGHLYYFNFSQMAFMAEAEAATKSAVFQKLTPKTMFYFRYGALFTFLTGWAMIGHKLGTMGVAGLTSAWGTVIMTGGLIGTLMFLNVWLIIWPNNRLMIENAVKTAKGETPIPGIADLAARAAVASRTNTLFSIPMLFFMSAASHLPLSLSPEKSLVPYWSVFGILVGAIELNAIKGKMGILQKLVHVVHGGIVLSILLYAAMAFLAG